MQAWMWWVIWISLVSAAIYVFALIGYRISLSVKKLSAEMLTLATLGEEIKSFTDLKFSPAKANGPKDLFALQRARKKMKQDKERERQDRTRRLIKRVSEMQIDEGLEP